MSLSGFSCDDQASHCAASPMELVMYAYRFARCMELLEARILFDAAPIVPVEEPPPPPDASYSEESFLTSSPIPVSSVLSTTSESEAPEIAERPEDPSPVRELVVIDSRVRDSESMLAAIAERQELHVLILNKDSDSLSQIAAALQDIGTVSAIHLISHAESGVLILGEERLDVASIYGASFAGWSNLKPYLSENADILLYGCELGSGELGQMFLQSLSDVTGADVSASNDLTGTDARGGNWNLESNYGVIETQSLSLLEYRHLLASPNPFPDFAVIVPGSSMTLDLLANDIDRDGDTLQISGFVDPAHPNQVIALTIGGEAVLASGTKITLLSRGEIKIELPAGISRVEKIQYLVTDGSTTTRQIVTVSTDNDGDGVRDLDDLDDDNDGILDVDEMVRRIVHLDVMGSFNGTVNDTIAPQGWSVIVSSPDLVSLTTPTTWLTSGNPTNGWGTQPVITPVVSSVDGGTWIAMAARAERIGRILSGLPKNVELHLEWEQTNYGVNRGTTTQNAAAGWTFTLYSLSPDGTRYLVENTVNGEVIGPTAQWTNASAVIRTTDFDQYFFEINPNLAAGYIQMDGLKIWYEEYVGVDTDGDGVFDHLDIDSDNDGIVDQIEAQSTANYKSPSHVYNAQGVDLHYATGLKPVDTDGDGIADFRDSDSDNDGRLDIEERGDGQPSSVTSLADSDRDGLLDIFENGTTHDGYVPADGVQPFGHLSADSRLDNLGANAVPLTIDYSFREVSEAPLGKDHSIGLEFGGTHVFRVDDFGFHDPYDSPADTFTGVFIEALPSNGLLLLNGQPVQPHQFISVEQINQGELTWTAPDGQFGSRLANVSIRVADDGRTTGGGKNVSAEVYKLSFDVKAPVLALELREDTFTGLAGLSLHLDLLKNDPSNTSSKLTLFEVAGIRIRAGETIDTEFGSVTLNEDGTIDLLVSNSYRSEVSFLYSVVDEYGNQATSQVQGKVLYSDLRPDVTADGRVLGSGVSLGSWNTLSGTPVWDALDPRYIQSGSSGVLHGSLYLDPNDSQHLIRGIEENQLSDAIDQDSYAEFGLHLADQFPTNRALQLTGFNLDLTVENSSLRIAVIASNDPNFNVVWPLTTDWELSMGSQKFDLQLTKPIELVPASEIYFRVYVYDAENPDAAIVIRELNPRFTVTQPNSITEFIPNSGPVSIHAQGEFRVSDFSEGDLASATVSISGLRDGENESIAIGDSRFSLKNDWETQLEIDGIDVSYTFNAASMRLDIGLAGGGRIASDSLSAALQRVQYQNDSSLPTSGAREFRIVVSDLQGLTSSEAISFVTVGSVVEAISDRIELNEDTSIELDLLANDSSADGTPLFISEINGLPISPGRSVQVDHGVVYMTLEGRVHFVPTADFHGETRFSYSIVDSRGIKSDQNAEVTLHIEAIVDALDDFASTDEDTPVTIQVGSNDTFQSGWKGTQIVLPDQAIAAPSNLGNGQDVSAGVDVDLSSELSVGVTLNMSESYDRSKTFAMTSSSVEVIQRIRFVANVDSIYGSIGALVTDTNGNVLAGYWEVLPPGVQQDGDWILKRVDDSSVGTPLEFVFVLDDPAAADQVVLGFVARGQEPTQYHISEIQWSDERVPANIVEVNGLAIGPDSMVRVEHGQVRLHPDNSLEFFPDKDFVGKASFTYTVMSGGVLETAQVFVDVRPVNDTPSDSEETVIIDEDTPIHVDAGEGLLSNASDVDGDPLRIDQIRIQGVAYSVSPTQSTVVALEEGILTIRSDGSYDFVPTQNYSGNVPTIEYRIVDDQGGEKTSMLRIRIDAMNDTPWITGPTSWSTYEDTAVTLSGLELGDPDGMHLHARLTLEVPSRMGSFIWKVTDGVSFEGNRAGQLILSGTPTAIQAAIRSGGLTFAPASDFYGAVPIQILYDDLGNSGKDPGYTGGPTSEQFIFSSIINVKEVNDAPQAQDDLFSIAPSTETILNLLSNDVDRDGDPIRVAEIIDTRSGKSLVIVPNGEWQLSSGAILKSDSNGVLSIRMEPGTLLNDTFQYRISDGRGGESVASVTISRSAFQPVAQDDHYEFSTRNLQGNAFENDQNPDRQPLIGSVIVPPSHGRLEWSPQGRFIYTPGATYAGQDSFRYQIQTSDGKGTFATVHIRGAFAKDSFTDESNRTPGDREDDESQSTAVERVRREGVDYFQVSEESASERVVLKDSEPVLAGKAAPGTVLVGRIYDNYGNLVGEATSQANEVGNWVLQFYGTSGGPKTHVVIEHVATEDVQLGDMGQFELTQNTYRSFQLSTSHQKPGGIGNVLTNTPTMTVEAFHAMMSSPLTLLNGAL